MNQHPSANPQTQRIGDYFIQTGRLSAADVEQITHLQASEGLRFGDAAVKLGLLHDDEIRQILSEQYRYPTAQANPKLQAYPIASSPQSAEAEAIRRLRTEILLRQPLENTCSLAVVSAAGHEGCSYVATSLALAFAQNGQRTLLINGNLRHRNNTGLFASQRPHGLSSVLAGRQTLADCLDEQDFPNLATLDSGPLPPNPVELLAIPAFRRLRTEIATQFDIIVVDTPPANLFSDSALIAQQVDTSIIVARQNYSLVSDIRKTWQLLERNGAAVMGTVYNTYSGGNSQTQHNGSALRRWARQKSNRLI